MMQKPEKIDDKKLLKLIETKINSCDYFITQHARERMIERGVTETHILNILLGKSGYQRKRLKRYDKYELDKQQWNYRFYGYITANESYLNIVLSFEDNLMPIITVFWDGEDK